MNEKVVLERDDLRRTLRRIAHEIAEKNPGPEGLALVGIHTRGAILAGRLHALVGELSGAEADDIIAKIAQASGRKIEATRSVDPSLIGGMVLQAGSFRADASVLGRLNSLRQELAIRG